MQSLSTEEAFSPFLQPNATWKKKTKKNPLRGFTGPDASEKTTILELMLLRITGFAPVLSRQTIVKNSTSLNYIWEALELYYGIDNCHDPNICLSQSSTPHQPSHRSHSEPSQTTLLEIETSQAPKDAKEWSESAPLHQDTQLSPSEPSLTAIPEEETSQAPQHVSEQSKSAPLLHDTQKSPSTAVDLINQHESLNVQDTTSHGQPTQESTGEAGDPQTLATFSRPLAKSCIQRDLPEHFPGNHVSRPDYSLLSSGPVFADSCELDHPSYPVTPLHSQIILCSIFLGIGIQLSLFNNLRFQLLPFAHCPSHKVILLMPVQQNGHILTSKPGIEIHFLMCKMSSSTL